MNINQNCRQYRETITALVLEELDAPAAEQLQQHLQACPACQQFQQTLTDQEQILRASFDDLADLTAQKQPLIVNQLDQLNNQQTLALQSTNLPHRLWIGVKTMNKISKIAAVLALTATLIGIIALFNQTRAQLAFADELNHLQQKNYTCTMTTLVPDGGLRTGEIQFHHTGKMRFDSTGPDSSKITSIIDVNQRKSLIFFHQLKIAQYIEIPQYGQRGSNPYDFLNQPIMNLWNLRDGTEQRLESRQINGQLAEGFRVLLQEEHFQQEITIWSHSQTGAPLLVEIVVTSPTEPDPPEKVSFSDFKLDVELDESLFLPPEDYTIAGIKTLEEVLGETKILGPTPNGLHIEQAIDLWSQDQKDQAAEILRNLDWSQPVRVSQDTYALTLTEKQWASLFQTERDRVLSEIWTVNGYFRPLARHLVSLGQTALSEGDTEAAQTYLQTVYHFGQLITGDADAVISVRMVGFAVTQLGLQELIAFYTQTNNQEKLQWAQNELDRVKAEHIKFRDSMIKN